MLILAILQEAQSRRSFREEGSFFIVVVQRDHISVSALVSVYWTMLLEALTQIANKQELIPSEKTQYAHTKCDLIGSPFANPSCITTLLKMASLNRTSVGSYYVTSFYFYDKLIAKNEIATLLNYNALVYPLFLRKVCSSLTRQINCSSTYLVMRYKGPLITSDGLSFE